MRWTLKELLKQCRVALKKVGTKREKWVKEWAGQLLITASQIQWTSDCTKALSSTKDKQVQPKFPICDFGIIVIWQHIEPTENIPVINFENERQFVIILI